MEIGNLADWVSGLATVGALLWAITFEKRKKLTILFRLNQFTEKDGVHSTDGSIVSLIITPVNNGKVSLEIAFSKLILLPNFVDKLLYRKEPRELSTPELFYHQHTKVAKWQVLEQNRSGKIVEFEYPFLRNQIQRFSSNKNKYFFIEVSFVDSSMKKFKKKMKIKVAKVKDL